MVRRDRSRANRSEGTNPMIPMSAKGRSRSALHARKLTLLVLLAAHIALSPIVDAVARDSVKVATVHFGPTFGDVEGNRARLVALTKEAAENGAQIIVHTEM